MNVATLIKAAHPLMMNYLSYFDDIYDGAYAIGREAELEEVKHKYDSFEAVYNRLFGAATLIENARVLEGEEPHGIVVTMLDIYYSHIESQIERVCQKVCQ